MLFSFGSWKAPPEDSCKARLWANSWGAPSCQGNEGCLLPLVPDMKGSAIGRQTRHQFFFHVLCRIIHSDTCLCRPRRFYCFNYNIVIKEVPLHFTSSLVSCWSRIVVLNITSKRQFPDSLWFVHKTFCFLTSRTLQNLGGEYIFALSFFSGGRCCFALF